MRGFDYTLDFKTLNFREDPYLYRVGRGEQGVLLVEPYKSEILPLWRFKNPEIAQKSAKALEMRFNTYLREGDFVGMDMTRKFIQMGYTRSRRYANHRTGNKYLGPVPPNKKGQSGSHGRKTLPLDIDPVKARSAEIFLKYWKKIESNVTYAKLKNQWKLWYG